MNPFQDLSLSGRDYKIDLDLRALLQTCDVWHLTLCYGLFDFESFWKYFMSGKSFPRIINVWYATLASTGDIEKLLKTTWDLDFHVRFHFYSCRIGKEEGETTSVLEVIKDQPSLLRVDRRVVVENSKGSEEVVFGARKFYWDRPEGVCELSCERFKEISEQKQNYMPEELFPPGILNELDLSLLSESELAEMDRRLIALCTVGVMAGGRFSGWDKCVANAAAAAATPRPMDSPENSRKRSRVECSESE